VTLTEDEMMEGTAVLEIPFASYSVDPAANVVGEVVRIFVFLKATSFDQRVAMSVLYHDLFDVVERETEKIDNLDCLEMMLAIQTVVVEESCEKVKHF